MKRRAFFVLEGIDGSGKSTLAVGWLRLRKELGRECELTAEPTAPWTGDPVRRANKGAR